VFLAMRGDEHARPLNCRERDMNAVIRFSGFYEKDIAMQTSEQ